MTAREIFYAPSGTLRAWWRVGGFILVYLAANYVFVGVARSLPLPMEMRRSMMTGWLVVLAAALFANVVMLRMVDGRSWSSIGLGADQARPRVMALGLAMGGLGILVPSGLLLAAHWLAPGPASDPVSTVAGFTLRAAFLFLPQSLAEELISRGYGFAAIREGAGPVAAIAITSLIFGAQHWLNPGADLWSVGIVVIAGVWLGAIVVLTRSVYAAWMAHFAWNFAIVGILHAKVSGMAFPTPAYTVVDAGPSWATGGSWGPEGSALAALSVIASVGLLYLGVQKHQSLRAPEFANA